MEAAICHSIVQAVMMHRRICIAGHILLVGQRGVIDVVAAAVAIGWYILFRPVHASNTFWWRIAVKCLKAGSYRRQEIVNTLWHCALLRIMLWNRKFLCCTSVVVRLQRHRLICTQGPLIECLNYPQNVKKAHCTLILQSCISIAGQDCVLAPGLLRMRAHTFYKISKLN